jgi:RNase P/RNase MRP subunit p29
LSNRDFVVGNLLDRLEGIEGRIAELEERSSLVEKTGYDDIEIVPAERGVILTDRTTGARYRLYVDGGSLSVEAV